MELPLVASNAKLKATGYIKDIPVRETRQGTELRPEAIKKSRQVFLGGTLAETPVYERAGLRCGNVIRGPAIIEEPFHTAVLPQGQVLHVDRWGNLVIETEAGS